MKRLIRLESLLASDNLNNLNIMSKTKRLDFLMIIIIPMLTAVILSLWRANFFLSTLLLFGLPSLYLIYKYGAAVKKTFIFSVVFSIPFTFILDYLISRDRGWYIIDTIFSFRVFDVIALEQFLWGFLCVFYIVIFYEYFLDKTEPRPIIPLLNKAGESAQRHMEYFSIALSIVLFIFVALAFWAPELLVLDYAYLILGILLGVIPLTIFLFRFQDLVVRFFASTVYFIFFSMIVEYTGLKLNHWIFPGHHFLGMINFFGFPIPYEEVILYFFFSAPIVLAYYEFFCDDRQ